jgi:hypothetical protein
MPRITGPIQGTRPLNSPPRAANAAAPMRVQSAAATPRATAVTAQPVAVATTARSSSSTGCNCSACASLQCLDRTRYFSGMLLSEADLNNEQSYLLAKNRLHNQYLHGTGVVCGMTVTCSECDGWVTVNPGYAIDPCGNDIIVCAAQSFNVLQAIQACATPQQAANCSPLRYNPAPNCQDMPQTWCITIQYQEQQTSMVTPLQQTSTKSSSGGCGCGCGGGSAKSAGTGCGCGSTTGTASAGASSSTAAACQATRIAEGFQLGVCQTSASERAAAEKNTAPQPGTYDYQVTQCAAGLATLIAQGKNLLGNLGSNNQLAYLAASQYLASAKSALASASVTNCSIDSALNSVSIVKPTEDDQGYIESLSTPITKAMLALRKAGLGCLCLSLLPPCPPAPCDNRLILACVTVLNGKITNICHFGGGRKQVITFPGARLLAFGPAIGLPAGGHLRLLRDPLLRQGRRGRPPLQCRGLRHRHPQQRRKQRQRGLGQQGDDLLFRATSGCRVSQRRSVDS